MMGERTVVSAKSINRDADGDDDDDDDDRKRYRQSNTSPE
jgi:hypothetical protein